MNYCGKIWYYIKTIDYFEKKIQLQNFDLLWKNYGSLEKLQFYEKTYGTMEKNYGTIVNYMCIINYIKVQFTIVFFVREDMVYSWGSRPLPR